VSRRVSEEEGRVAGLRLQPQDHPDRPAQVVPQRPNRIDPQRMRHNSMSGQAGCGLRPHAQAFVRCVLEAEWDDVDKRLNACGPGCRHHPRGRIL